MQSSEYSTQSKDENSVPVFTKQVKAGKRTYFFDVRQTRGHDYFMTITENRKRTNSDGSITYDRTKIFLYKEDFAKFSEGLSETIDYVRHIIPDFFEQQVRFADGATADNASTPSAADLEFESLGQPALSEN